MFFFYWQDCSAGVANRHIYDPIFILHLSFHCLSMGYIEPVEFANLGLLAVSLASISSPDGDTRKLGYGVLEKFKNALEVCYCNISSSMIGNVVMFVY